MCIYMYVYMNVYVNVSMYTLGCVCTCVCTSLCQWVCECVSFCVCLCELMCVCVLQTDALKYNMPQPLVPLMLRSSVLACGLLSSAVFHCSHILLQQILGFSPHFLPFFRPSLTQGEQVCWDCYEVAAVGQNSSVEAGHSPPPKGPSKSNLDCLLWCCDGLCVYTVLFIQTISLLMGWFVIINPQRAIEVNTALRPV